MGDETLFRTYVTKYLCSDSLIDINVPLFGKSVRKEIRYATEEEKRKLFDAIKDNGYKWNEEKKVLEKSNSFYTGEVLVSRSGNIVLLSHVDNKQIIYYHCILEPFGGFRIPETPDCGVGKISDCYLASGEQRDRLFDKLKKSGYKYNPRANKLEKLPRFKVGNRIKQIGFSQCHIIKTIEFDRYILNNNQFVRFRDEHLYELVPNKFDIGTLKPFESRVLVRDANCYNWEADIFGRYSDGYITLGGAKWTQCIPYEGNEHLLGTTDDCTDFYKIW